MLNELNSKMLARELNSRGSSICPSSAGSADSSPPPVFRVPQIPQQQRPPVALHPIITPPNSPVSPAAQRESEEEGIYLTAKLTQDEGPFTTTSTASSSTNNLGNFVQKLTELIGQLQSLEEAQADLFKEVLESDLDLKSALGSGNTLKKHGESLSNLFNINRRSSKDKLKEVRDKPQQNGGFCGAAAIPEEISRLQQAREEVVRASRETIVAVRDVRMRLGQSLDPLTYTDALRLANDLPSSFAPLEQGSGDWSYLHGRCFNLSLNLKILQGFGFADAATAGKCYTDLNVLESRLDVHWLSVCNSNVVEDLRKARRDSAAAAVADLTTLDTPEKSPPSALCLKLPVRRLLKLSPTKPMRM